MSIANGQQVLPLYITINSWGTSIHKLCKFVLDSVHENNFGMVSYERPAGDHSQLKGTITPGEHHSQKTRFAKRYNGVHLVIPSSLHHIDQVFDIEVLKGRRWLWQDELEEDSESFG